MSTKTEAIKLEEPTKADQPAKAGPPADIGQPAQAAPINLNEGQISLNVGQIVRDLGGTILNSDWEQGWCDFEIGVNRLAQALGLRKPDLHAAYGDFTFRLYHYEGDNGWYLNLPNMLVFNRDHSDRWMRESMNVMIEQGQVQFLLCDRMLTLRSLVSIGVPVLEGIRTCMTRLMQSWEMLLKRLELADQDRQPRLTLEAHKAIVYAARHHRPPAIHSWATWTVRIAWLYALTLFDDAQQAISKLYRLLGTLLGSGHHSVQRVFMALVVVFTTAIAISDGKTLWAAVPKPNLLTAWLAELNSVPDEGSNFARTIDTMALTVPLLGQHPSIDGLTVAKHALFDMQFATHFETWPARLYDTRPVSPLNTSPLVFTSKTVASFNVPRDAAAHFNVLPGTVETYELLQNTLEVRQQRIDKLEHRIMTLTADLTDARSLLRSSYDRVLVAGLHRSRDIHFLEDEGFELIQYESDVIIYFRDQVQVTTLERLAYWYPAARFCPAKQTCRRSGDWSPLTGSGG